MFRLFLKLLASFIFLLTIFWSIGVRAQQIGGQVISETTGLPLSGVSVYLPEHGVLTHSDSTGHFRFAGLLEGQYVIDFELDGYQRLNQSLSLAYNVQAVIRLFPGHRHLDEVLVTSVGKLQRETPVAVSVYAASALKDAGASTLGDVISEIPGVSQRSFGAGISKPVIRGLSGSSVVTYINGLRVENQQWGADHGLPLTSLGIGAVEVIKGPASLLYGADALGGVIYFADEAYAPQHSFSGFVNTRFNSVSMGSENQAGFKWSKKKLRINAWLGYDSHADYTTPGGLQLVNSRYQQQSGKLAIGYNHGKWVGNFRYNYYGAHIGLPGHSHDSVPDPESFYTTKQSRQESLPAQVVQNHYALFENKWFGKKQEFALNLGHTFSQLKEHEEKFFTPDIYVNLNTTQLTAKWFRHIGQKVTLNAGAQGSLQLNANPPGGTEKLVPDAQTIDAGAFLILHYKLKQWRFMGGLRLDQRQINVSNADIPAGFEARYVGNNFSIGATRPAKKSNIRFNVSSGFRAPTTSELLADGVHHGNFRYEKGAVDLKVEQAFQTDLGLSFFFDDLEIMVNPYFNRLRHYTYLSATDTLIDGFPVYQYTQADFANLYGAEVGFHFHPHKIHPLHLESNFAYTIATDNLGNPLPFIPAANIVSKIRFVPENGRKKVGFSSVVLQHRYAFAQNRPALFETSTPHYHVFNLSTSFTYRANNPLVLTLGVQNFLNAKYADHLSVLKRLGLPNPGLNAFLALRIEFSKSIKNKKQ